MSLTDASAGGVTHRFVDVGSGFDMHIAEAGAGTGPLVVLLHGFPECWYSWRHQLAALAEAGYHVVAPDQRGYGRAGAPPNPRVESCSLLPLGGAASPPRRGPTAAP